MGVQKQEKVLFEMYNQYFNGTVSSVVDTGIKLWDGTHNSWKMEVVYQKLTGQANLTTLFAVRPDFSPYSGIRNRMSGNNDSLEFTISDSWNIIKNDGEFTTYISATYGNALRKNAPLDYDTFIIIRNGNILSIDYNGYTAEVLITNPLTNNMNLLIGCDYKGTNNQTQRYYTGTVQKFVVTELPATYDAEIEYLESTGTSGFYITSGVVRPSDFTSVEIQTTVQFLSTSGRQIHGATNSLYFGVNNGKWECDYRQYVGTADTEDIHVLSKKMSVSNSDCTNSVYLDGNLIYTRTFTYDANNWNVPIGVFNYSNSSTAGWHARIFNEKIYVNDVLVRDMDPIRFGQLGYLYDKVSGLSFGNGSTGTFTLGPDKT